MKLVLLLLLGAVFSVRPVRWVEVCRQDCSTYRGTTLCITGASLCELKPECENPDGGWVLCQAR